MDRKTLGIGALGILAVLLLMACIFDQPVRAQGGFAIKDRDYQLITTPNQQGGDALYIVDNRSGRMAIFVYDVNLRRLKVVAVRDVADGFAK